MTNQPEPVYSSNPIEAAIQDAIQRNCHLIMINIQHAVRAEYLPVAPESFKATIFICKVNPDIQLYQGNV